MKAHPLDPMAFVFGVLFALIGTMFLSGHVDVSRVGGQWIWPALLAGAGLLLMVLTVRPARVRGERATDEKEPGGEDEPQP